MDGRCRQPNQRSARCVLDVNGHRADLLFEDEIRALLRNDSFLEKNKSRADGWMTSKREFASRRKNPEARREFGL
jgi:hypothetical protein